MMTGDSRFLNKEDIFKALDTLEVSILDTLG